MIGNSKVPLLGVAAASGVGKTTLLTQLIPLLRTHNIRVGIIKHSHHNFDIDIPGKDSYRLHQAGADCVLLVSPYRRAVISEINTAQEPELYQQLAYMDLEQLDLIMVEGFKNAPIPKIELYRAALKPKLQYPEDPHIIAVASDIALSLPPHLSLLKLNEPQHCVDFILNWLATE